MDFVALGLHRTRAMKVFASKVRWYLLVQQVIPYPALIRFWASCTGSGQQLANINVNLEAVPSTASNLMVAVRSIGRWQCYEHMHMMLEPV